MLQVVTWKVRVERKKGGDLASITAHNVSEFIANKFNADVSPKACQNALRHLTDHGYVTRREFKREGFKSVFAYGLAEGRSEAPVVFLDRSAGTSRDTPCPSASTEAPSAGTLSSPLYNYSKNKNLNKADVVDEPGTSTSPLSPPPVVNSHPTQPFVPPAGSKAYRSSGMSTTPTKVEGMRSPRSLAAIEALCQKIGNRSLPNPADDSQAYIDARLREN